MCGIAGVVVPDGRAAPRAAVARMVAALRHGGPDDEGLEVVQGVVLGRTRLSILDPSPAGHQPMAHPGGGWWLTYNGEAFNHLDLRKTLPPREWRGTSDTETVLVDLHVIPTDAATWRRDLVSVVQHLESPMLHESSIPMAQIATLAREHGVKVLLSGEGADELFGGYTHLHLTQWRDYTRQRPGPERAARTAVRRLRRLLRRVPWPDLEPGTGPSADVRDYERAVMSRARSAYDSARSADRPLSVHLLADLSLYLPHLLNRQDKTTMRASIETRVPFLDPSVVQLALNLPIAVRMRPDRKEPLRALARRMLPAVVTARPKVGFGFDVVGYLSEQRPEFLAGGALREVLEIGTTDWSEALPSLGGRHPMLLTSGEIWARLFARGDDPGEVERALWG